MVDVSALDRVVARAKPYIDAGGCPTKWPASSLLVIGWCLIASSPSGNEEADKWVNGMLEEARHRYAAGFYANPFEEPVRARPIGSVADA